MKRHAILPLLLLPVLVHAAKLTVSSLEDDGSAGTLRALCAAAASGDEIVFADSLAGGTIALTTASGPIEITTTLSIVGPEDAPVTIDGRGGAGGVRAYAGGSRTTYLLHATDADSTLTLRNLVFTGSKANAGKDSAGNAAADVGPAVSVLGSAVVENCVWTNNAMNQTVGYATETGDGGTCLRVVGDLSLSNCTFVDNGINSSVCSIGGAVAALGENVTVSDCIFDGFYGWDRNKPGNSIRGGGAIGILGGDSAATKNIRVERCFFRDLWANAGAAALFVRKDVTDGSFVVRDCVFREMRGYSANQYSGGGGVVSYEGGGSPRFVFENTEFSNVASSAWGGAVRVSSGSANVVFANCTFVNCTGNEWGSATDTRCATCFVNCTAAGNVNRSTQTRGSVFFSISKAHHLLNSVCAWNYRDNGSVWEDTVRYDSTLGVYNSYNHVTGNAPNATDNAMDYDGNTAMFVEPLATLSSFDTAGQTWTFANDIVSPALSIDEKAEKSDPFLRRVVEILPKTDGGVLDRAGWPVKHSADWSSIAYTKDDGATWTALVGSADDATILLLADSRGEPYPRRASDGLPKCPIGSATVVAETQLLILVR